MTHKALIRRLQISCLGLDPIDPLRLLVDDVIAALAQTEQEPVAHPVIAGALFDFMGWLTSRKERIVLSSADNASPAVEAITEFAKMRNLSLDDAKVQDWNTTPPQRTWVGLEGEEIRNLWEEATKPDRSTMTMVTSFAKSIEAKLKERNT
jgi:hypothetical protein